MIDTLWLVRKTFLSTFKNPINLLLYSVGRLDSMLVREIEEPEVKDLIASGELDAAIILPAGFTQSLIDSKPAEVQIVSIKGAQVTGQVANGDEVKFNDLYEDFQKSGFHLSAEKVENQSVNHNKTNQSIGYLLILMLVSSSSLSGIPFWSMFLILMLFALVAISLSLAIVAFSSRSSIASGMQNMILIPIPTSLMAGCMFPIALMPAAMQQLAHFLPQYWLLDTFSNLQQGVSMGDLSLNLLILAAFAGVLSLIAVYKFGRNNDTRSYI
ncbi:hypothetical protein GCM10010912_40400 [Paenibacillus albidus]|uniref:ABC-2 type transporter transmembrane domain-containing protein n=1 Tax=Paenibacillus albidus TaxID=2041023 RepID=A0A917FNB7_9BACL|nr:ABC transporter permease [Paenibacillus albidus]GGF91279.1 hypothetical protein GCM10010912_40400 [Paenibacillus albidus]